MAKYVELVMIEQRYGKEASDALIAYEEGRYRVAQARSSQPTLALVDAVESFDAYSRSTLVFAKLREVVGDEPVVAALRHLFLTHAYPQKPATSMDFVRALKHQTEENHHALIDTLFVSRDIALILE
jgi:aminopeptidase N